MSWEWRRENSGPYEAVGEDPIPWQNNEPLASIS